jgi:hypothetical protein
MECVPEGTNELDLEHLENAKASIDLLAKAEKEIL